MIPSPFACPSCAFDCPRAFRSCPRCRQPLGSSPRPTQNAPDATVVAPSPSFEEREGGLLLASFDDAEPPLVGQVEAADAIHRGIETAFSRRLPTLVALEGERGSGKTRLLLHAAELAVRLAGEPRVLYGACRAERDGYYAPFGRLLLERFQVVPSSSPVAVRGQMTTHVTEALGSDDAITIAETTHLLGHLAGVPFPDSPFLRAGDDATERKARAIAAFRRFVEGDASKRPVVLLLDQMHAADDDAWELVDALLTIEAPIAIVIAGLPPLLERAERKEARGGVALGALAPWSELEVASFVQTMLPSLVEVPEPLMAALTHRSRGNPSALRELIFALVEAGLFVATDDGLVADLGRLESGQLPVSIHDAIAARLVRLDGLELATVERACVIGDVFFDRCVLAQMRSERRAPGQASDPVSLWPNDDDESALAAALGRLEEKNFIERIAASDLPGVREYRFVHPGTREHVYRDQKEDLRLFRHRIIADWLSVIAEQHKHRVAALAGPHLEKAGMLGRAGRAYLEAARDEHRRMHTQTALRHAERALELIEAGDLGRRIDALQVYGSLLTTLGRYDEARGAFAQMLETAWRIGARTKGGAALNALAKIHRMRGDDALAEQLLMRALTLLKASDDHRAVAAALDELAQIHRLRGDLTRAHEAAHEALELRRSHGDAEGEALSLGTLGSIELARGELESAERLFGRARELREALGDRAGLMQVYNSLGVVAFDRGDAERAEMCWRAALQEARKMADRHMQSMLLNNLGEALAHVGRFDEAEAMLREARALAHALRNKRAMAEIERNLGLTQLRRGDDEAERTLMRSLALAEEYGAKEAIALAHRAIGQLRARTLFDDHGALSRRAEESFLASIDTFRDIGNEKEAARSLADLGHHLIERGDVDSAKERLHEARAIMRRIGLGQLPKVEAMLQELG